MAELTFRVETPLPGWDHGAVVTVERSPFVDALLDTGRVVLLSDEESAALDQGEEPEATVEVDAYTRVDPDGDVVPVRAYRRRPPADEAPAK
jgi:hypothetical protein